MKLFRTALKIAATMGGVKGMRSTYRPKVGPFTVNTSTRNGISSVSLGAGPLRYKVWDRKGNTGLSSVDLPGPVSYRPPRQG